MLSGGRTSLGTKKDVDVDPSCINVPGSLVLPGTLTRPGYELFRFTDEGAEPRRLPGKVSHSMQSKIMMGSHNTDGP